MLDSINFSAASSRHNKPVTSTNINEDQPHITEVHQRNMICKYTNDDESHMETKTMQMVMKMEFSFGQHLRHRICTSNQHVQGMFQWLVCKLGQGPHLHKRLTSKTKGRIKELFQRGQGPHQQNKLTSMAKGRIKGSHQQQFIGSKAKGCIREICQLGQGPNQQQSIASKGKAKGRFKDQCFHIKRSTHHPQLRAVDMARNQLQVDATCCSRILYDHCALSQNPPSMLQQRSLHP